MEASKKVGTNKLSDPSSKTLVERIKTLVEPSPKPEVTLQATPQGSRNRSRENVRNPQKGNSGTGKGRGKGRSPQTSTQSQSGKFARKGNQHAALAPQIVPLAVAVTNTPQQLHYEREVAAAWYHHNIYWNQVALYNCLQHVTPQFQPQQPTIQSTQLSGHGDSHSRTGSPNGNAAWR